MMDSQTIQRVKDAASIVEVAADLLPTVKKGAAWQCLCPFHDDRHLGSFVISPRRNTFACYSCGERGDAIDLVMKVEGLGFLDAVRWIAAKYGIATGEAGEGRWRRRPTACKAHTAPVRPPMLELPMEMVAARNWTGNNTLCNWLRGLRWDAGQRARVEKTLRNYLVGTSRQGHTIFWQVDEQGRVRTGKMMLYRQDGHRDKTTPGNFGWVHSRLARAGRIDEDAAEMQQCLFGLHMLDLARPRTVCVVESEKTALVCAIAYGNPSERLWLATGGKTQLTREKMQPLIERGVRVVLYPDHDGVEEWAALARATGCDRLEVDTDFMARHWMPEDGAKADIADVLVRIIETGGGAACAETSDTTRARRRLFEQWKAESEVLARMAEAFDLTPIATL